MNLTTRILDGKSTLQITYTPHELALIENRLRSLGLTEHTTENAWNQGETLRYYRDRQGVLEALVAYAVGGYDGGINRLPVSDRGGGLMLSLSALRVIPEQGRQSSYTVTIPAPLLRIDQWTNLCSSIATTISALLGLAIEKKSEIKLVQR